MFSSSLLATALSSLLSLALVSVPATAIPLHLDARGDAGMKIVFDITCTPLSGAAGNLFMMSTASGTSVPLTLVNDTLQEDDTADDGSSQQFAFQNCTSTFMDLTPTDTTFYGHVTLVSNSSACLVSNPGQTAPQPVTTMPCRTADDSGQMLQFWKFTTATADPSTPAQIEFVGKSANSDFNITYVTDFTGTEGSRVVQIDSVEGTPADLPYQITLVPAYS